MPPSSRHLSSSSCSPSSSSYSCPLSSLRAYVCMLLLLVFSLSLFVGVTEAYPSFRDSVPNGDRIHGTAAAGHEKKLGGGMLNFFGKDFDKQGQVWTKELCEMDSDGDGISNGHELGDSCCEWTPGKAPLRDRKISAPGNFYSRTPTEMPECGNRSDL
eukprot:TRINITY_DN11888_c0_g1_i1.p1 TRINITY_DN11888_c0_g1~~TRINITY_DN11888_c0_g1_i1.p1  ORF type:complete len:158 (+),score=33.44 TRINITY_DN11888_c0_g1_i1:3-476(+)